MSESTTFSKTEPNAAYHADREYITKSRLAKMQSCPAYFIWAENNPSVQTEDMALGSAFHKLVLEFDDFESEFAVAPLVDRRYKEGKQIYNDFLEANADKTIITQEQYDTAMGMRESLLANPYAKAMLKGTAEQSIYFVDEMTGEKCKIRPDIVRPLNSESTKLIIVDLKSTRSAETGAFARDIVKYSYDLQAYMYTYGASLLYGIPMDKIQFYFVAVEKTAPYLTNVLRVDESIMQRGEALFRYYIGTLHYCKETNNWYSYNGKDGDIGTVTLPAWATLNE